MFGAAVISNEQRAIIAARIKQRVKELLPPADYILLVQEIPCPDGACPTRYTIISACDEAGNLRKWAIHAPMILVTSKEIELVIAA